MATEIKNTKYILMDRLAFFAIYSLFFVLV
jgi:hypothetical protein